MKQKKKFMITFPFQPTFNPIFELQKSGAMMFPILGRVGLRHSSLFIKTSLKCLFISIGSKEKSLESGINEFKSLMILQIKSMVVLKDIDRSGHFPGIKTNVLPNLVSMKTSILLTD